MTPDELINLVKTMTPAQRRQLRFAINTESRLQALQSEVAAQRVASGKFPISPRVAQRFAQIQKQLETNPDLELPPVSEVAKD
jgi:hypothetical protein